MPDKKELLKEVKNDLFCKTGKQTSMLYSSQILVLLLGVFTGAINTRTLGPEGYGLLSFYVAITSFILLFFNFGIFSSSGYLVAHEKDEKKKKELFGASIICTFTIGILYSLAILAASFFIDDLFKTQIGWILRYTSILLLAFPSTALITQLSKGSNKIGILSIFNILPKIIYLIGILLLLKIIKPDYSYFAVIYSLSIFISCLLAIASFKPAFSNIAKSIGEIIQTTKTYGFYTYIGMIADQSSYQLSSILIPLFFGTTNLGFYALGVTICSPMAGLSQSLSISMFKDFAHLKKIPKKVLYYNAAWLIFCVIFLLVFGELIISTIFTKDFLPVLPLIPFLALAYMFNGLCQPYHTFLGAKGKGLWLMNRSFFMAAVSIIANILLIPLYGNLGAAVAAMLGMGSGYLTAIWYYNKYGI